MTSSSTSGDWHFGKNASANSSPGGFSTAADTIRIGTSGFRSFISRAISVPVLALRKWSDMTKSIGLCLKSSRPSSPDLAVSTFYPSLPSRSFLTRSAISASSIHKMTGSFAGVEERGMGAPPRKYNATTLFGIGSSAIRPSIAPHRRRVRCFRPGAISAMLVQNAYRFGDAPDEDHFTASRAGERRA